MSSYEYIFKVAINGHNLKLYKRIEFSPLASKIFANWPSIVFSLAWGKRKVKARFKNGVRSEMSRSAILTTLRLAQENKIESVTYENGKLELNNKIILDPLLQSNNISLTIDLLKRGWKVEGDAAVNEEKNLRFLGANIALIETFEDREYDFDVMDKEVVDIGANIGDTAVFFARKGASKVIAVEPLPSVCKIAEENFRLNGCEEKICLINAALASAKKNFSVPAEIDPVSSTKFSTLKSKNGVQTAVNGITVSEILENLRHPYLLKLDCQGSEYDVVLNDYEHASKFENIIVEYHSYISGMSVSRLVDALSADYICEQRGNPGSIKEDKIGILYCHRRN